MPSKKKSEPEKQNPKPVLPWVRLQSVTGSVDREVDVDQVEKLLADRWEAKLQKNYSEADKIALTLQGMNIAYHDDKKTWYTKAVPTPVAKSMFAEKPKKLTKKQERNKRQAEKNRRKKSLNASEDDDSVGQESESEEEEETVKPSKKKAKRDD